MKQHIPMLTLMASLIAAFAFHAQSSPASALAEAMPKEGLAMIRVAVEEGRAQLGDEAGLPEVAEELRPVPANATLLTSAEAQRGFTPH